MASLARRLGLVKTPSSGSDSSPSGDNIEKMEPKGESTATEVRTQDELEANKRLRRIRDKHRWDPNMPDDIAQEIDEVTAQRDAKGEFGIVEEIIEDSPYPEVRAAARNVSLCVSDRKTTPH